MWVGRPRNRRGYAPGLERLATNAEPRPGVTPDSRQLPRRLLLVGLVLAVLVAAGGLLQALTSGLGPHPSARLEVGISLLIVSLGGLVLRERLLVSLSESPRLVLGIAGAQAVIVSFDGLPASPYFASCLIPIGIAILAGGARLAWDAAAIVDGVLVLSMIGAGATPSFAGGAGTTVGALLAPPAATVALATIIRAYERTTGWIAENMADAGVSRVAFASAQVLLPPSYEDYQPVTPWARLTPSEVRIAGALARCGKTAAISRAEGLADSTVDNELASAMRKTGCRTRSQLAALTAHPDWPEGQRW